MSHKILYSTIGYVPIYTVGEYPHKILLKMLGFGIVEFLRGDFVTINASKTEAEVDTDPEIAGPKRILASLLGIHPRDLDTHFIIGCATQYKASHYQRSI